MKTSDNRLEQLLQQTISHSAKKYQVADRLQVTNKLWLACSGGRDSMALALAILQLYQQQKLAFMPELMYVNHGLQAVNDDWENFIKAWAKSNNIPCHILHLQLTKSDEQSARQGRYQAMAQLMAEGDILLLAHHANDQVETLLMRLFNGAGVTGLSGIKEWHQKTIGNKLIYLWRPWLTVSRQQITDYVRDQQLPYVDDPTNIQGDNTRSWLRMKVLPVIHQYYPQATPSMVRSTELLNDAQIILAEVYQQDLEFCTNSELSIARWDLVLDIDKLQALSRARQRQLIHKWLQGSEPNSASKHRIDEILHLIHRKNTDQQSQLDWQADNYQYSVRRFRNQLHRLRSDWLLALTIHVDNVSVTLPSKLITKKTDQDQLIFTVQTNQGTDNQGTDNRCTDNQNTNKQSAHIKKAYTQNINISWSINLSIIDDAILDNIDCRLLQKKDTFGLNPKQKAQSGKKLMQMLAIPSWERETVTVIMMDEVILGLITARQLWWREDLAHGKLKKPTLRVG